MACQTILNPKSPRFFLYLCVVLIMPQRCLLIHVSYLLLTMYIVLQRLALKGLTHSREARAVHDVFRPSRVVLKPWTSRSDSKLARSCSFGHASLSYHQEQVFVWISSISSVMLLLASHQVIMLGNTDGIPYLDGREVRLEADVMASTQ